MALQSRESAIIETSPFKGTHARAAINSRESDINRVSGDVSKHYHTSSRHNSIAADVSEGIQA